MTGDDQVRIWTAAEVDDGQVPAEYLPPVREILEWARSQPHLRTRQPGRPQPRSAGFVVDDSEPRLLEPGA